MPCTCTAHATARADYTPLAQTELRKELAHDGAQWEATLEGIEAEMEAPAAR